MKIRTSGLMLSAAMAALLLAQGCARKEPAAATTAASAPEAAATTPAAATEATTEATTEVAAESTAAAPAETVASAGLEAGGKIYKTYCLTCHGATGKGDGPASAALNPKPADFADNMFKYDVNGNGTKGDIDDIKAIVHDGAAKHGGSPLMTPWPMIKPEQLQAVAEYVKSLHG
ncbi:MAG: cytochrome c [Steroidobacteraceae bacterium]